MFEDITKEEFEIYNIVSDKLDDIINNKNTLINNPNNSYYNISYLLICIISIFGCLFIYYTSQKHIISPKKPDEVDCNNGFCFKIV